MILFARRYKKKLYKELDSMIEDLVIAKRENEKHKGIMRRHQVNYIAGQLQMIGQLKMKLKKRL